MKMPPTRAATSNPIYDQIAFNLLNQIESGELSPGDSVPPEHELSENFGAKRLTLRRALQKFELQGLLNRHQGAG